MQSSPSPIPRALAVLSPSIGDVIFISILLFLMLTSAERLLGDGDTGYHIRTGEYILTTGTIPRADLYSFISPTLKWTAHEWLSEVIMAAVHRATGLAGVVGLFAILLALTHGLLYRLLRTKSDDILLCAAVTLLATVTTSSHWLARPHVFSMPLVLLWCYLLDRFQNDNKPTLKYLPILMVIWVNLHGGFILGLIFQLIYLGGNLLYSFAGNPSSAQGHRGKVKALSLTTAATIAACLVNPVGVEIFWFPFRVTSDRFVMDWVIEFMSPNFHQALPFKYMFMTMIAFLAIAPKRLNLIDTALLTLVTYMALYSVRHVAVFAIVVAPIFLSLSSALIATLPRIVLEFYRASQKRFAALDAQLIGYLWPAIAVTIVIGSTLWGGWQANFSAKTFPVAAVEFLKREQLAGNMFNNDEFGDYLIFTAWPQYKVFTDGRSDMYGEKHGRPYLKVASLQPGWKDILHQYNISWIFFQTKTALTAALMEQPDWHAIYSDNVATIFVRKSELHRHLIAKYPSVKVELD